MIRAFFFGNLVLAACFLHILQKLYFFALVPNLFMAYNRSYEMVDCCFWWKKGRC